MYVCTIGRVFFPFSNSFRSILHSAQEYLRDAKAVFPAYFGFVAKDSFTKADIECSAVVRLCQ